MATNKSIIDSSDPGIVAKEMPVHLSDEKLKALLSSTYERAQRDESSFKIYKHYGTFLSIAGTLFLTLMTASFNSVGQITAERISHLATCACIISAILGFVFMGITVSEKTKASTDSRDKAVKEMLDFVIKQE